MVISSLFFRFFFLFLQHAICVREEVERDDDDASASKERAGHITPAQLFIYISADTYTCPFKAIYYLQIRSISCQVDLLYTDTKHLVSGFLLLPAITLKDSQKPGRPLFTCYILTSQI